MVPFLKAPWQKLQVPDEVCLGMGCPFLMTRTPILAALRAVGLALGAIGPCPGGGCTQVLPPHLRAWGHWPLPWLIIPAPPSPKPVWQRRETQSHLSFLCSR